MQYITALKRLFKPKKYPLYRIIKLRYVFLHLFLLSFLLTLPNSVHLYQSIVSLKVLIEHHEDEIPNFTIINNALNLKDDTTIQLNGQTITFTTQDITPKTDIITFSKNNIIIKNMGTYGYDQLNMFSDKDDLVVSLNNFTHSHLFFYSLIVTVLIIIQYAITIVKIIGLSMIAHLFSQLFNRKSRYMSWLKIIAFLITFPTIITFLYIISAYPLYNVVAWCIMVMLIIITIYYLPMNRKKITT